MPSTILSDNGVSSGSAGLKTTAASDGSLALQTTTAGGTATTAVTIDTSQNMGLGVTPSAWSSTDTKAIQLRNANSSQSGNIHSTNDSVGLSQNSYYASGWKYYGTGASSLYWQESGAHKWGYAGSGTAGNAITFTQAMTLDASGNLGIGVTSPASGVRFDVRSNAAATLADMRNASSTGYGIYIAAGSSTSQYVQRWADYNNNALATIDGAGNLLVGQTAQSNVERLGVTFTGNNEGVYAVNSSASPTGTAITANFPSGTGTNGTGCILYKGRTAGVDRFYVYGNGNVVNTNNSYGALSDVKLKENITDTTPKLAQLNQVRVVNYNLIGDETKQLGVVAQELEQIFPAMVEQTPDRDAEGNDLGTTTKSVKYSVFVPMLIKAIQEQQAIIQQLQADVAALKGTQP